MYPLSLEGVWRPSGHPSSLSGQMQGRDLCMSLCVCVGCRACTPHSIHTTWEIQDGLGVFAAYQTVSFCAEACTVKTAKDVLAACTYSKKAGSAGPTNCGEVAAHVRTRTHLGGARLGRCECTLALRSPWGPRSRPDSLSPPLRWRSWVSPPSPRSRSSASHSRARPTMRGEGLREQVIDTGGHLWDSTLQGRWMSVRGKRSRPLDAKQSSVCVCLSSISR